MQDFLELTDAQIERCINHPTIFAPKMRIKILIIECSDLQSYPSLTFIKINPISLYITGLYSSLSWKIYGRYMSYLRTTIGVAVTFQISEYQNNFSGNLIQRILFYYRQQCDGVLNILNVMSGHKCIKYQHLCTPTDLLKKHCFVKPVVFVIFQSTIRI